MLKICIIITVILLNKIFASDFTKEEPEKTSWKKRVYHKPKNISDDFMKNKESYDLFTNRINIFPISANNRDEKRDILYIISKVPHENWEIFAKYALSISKITDYNLIKIKLIKMLTIVRPYYYETLLTNLEKLDPKYHTPLIDQLIKAKPKKYRLLLEKIENWSCNH